MKKFSILIYLLLSSFIILSQPCLPDGITFSTQNQINNFQVNYPNCTEIEGDVTISGNDISNLIGLGMLTSFGGDLLIENNGSLSNMMGLENIENIGGDFIFSGNNQITNFSVFGNLASIGGDVMIWGNNGLNSLTGLEGITVINGSLYIGMLTFTGNPSLTSLNGLNNISTINGSLYIEKNNVLSSMAGLDTLESIGGGFYLQDNHALSNLAGLEDLYEIGGALFIAFNDVVESTAGLNALNSIGGDLVIMNNPFLENTNGLENLEIIWGSLNIDGNNALSNLAGLTSLVSIGVDLLITNNPGLTTLSGIDNISAGSIENLLLHYNYSLSECAVLSICEYVNNPNGDIVIENNTTGCNDLEEVKDNCSGVGVEENITGQEILVSPNPASQYINVRCQIPDAGSLGSARDRCQMIEIYTIAGIKMIEKEFENEVVLNVNSLSRGVYIIRIHSRTKISSQKLIIKR